MSTNLNNLQDYINSEEFKSLTTEEQSAVFSVLKEMADNNGKSSTYNHLLYDDYSEIPVDIETFLTDDNYLGRAWKDASGKSKVYPFWMETLKKLFPTNIDTAYDTLLESGARGIGKAQPLDTPVFTENGYIPMGEVKLGTNVYGRDGKLHKVIGVFPQGVKPVYKIIFSDNTETLCSDEHLWKVINISSHNREKVMTLNEIIKAGLTTRPDKTGKFGYKYKIPMCDALQFESKKYFISPYVLGCLIGDGGTNYKDTVKFATIDIEIVDNMNTDLAINGYILSKYNQYASYGIKRIIKDNKPNEYAKEIEQLGLRCRAENKHIPQEYLFGDIDSRIDLLQGLMDTDGNCSKGGYCTFSTSSEKLKDDFIFLVESLGGTAPYRTREKRGYTNKKGEYIECLPSYEITVNLPLSIIPFRLTRKLSRMKKTKHGPSRTIHKIKYVGDQECQCILLDSDEHLYLTNDLIVTHNSEIGCGAVGAYLMYRIMCLKNPLEYYHLKPTEKICFAFMNIKKDLAKEIAIDKFQKTIQMSPWFMSRGRMTTFEGEPYWIPPNYISIIIGSQSDDVIGLPIFFCLDGDTIIKTTNGDEKLSSLVGKDIQVKSIDNDGNEVISEHCTVKPTLKTNEEYQIELEDGTIIKCTPTHRFMLKDGTYKEARYLTEEDELYSMGKFYLKINNICLIILKEEKQYYDVINAYPYNNFLIKTNENYICSHNCFQDEISFIRNQDIDKQKQKAKDMIDTAIGGMLTRFIHNGKNPTMLVVASSKRSEQSFMEEYIRTLSEGENKTKVYVVDKPVWEVKPKGTYGEGVFYVGLGNKFLSSIVIPYEDNDNLDKYKEKGYKIIEVPKFFRAKFLEDIDRNLCDIAGISVTSSSKYMSAQLVSEVINPEYKNPFPDIIETGNGKDDLAQYKQFFNMDNVPKELMRKPLFVHLDMSISGDMTGIAGVWILGKKVTTDGNPSKDLSFRLAFSTSIKAPKGYQISFEKNRNFIRWLKEVGFNIKKISYDTFQSYDTGQQLKAEGFDCMILSVDRVDQDKICKPYQYIKSAISEKRFVMYKSDRLFDEFIDVERNINSGKVDHTRNGHKDVLDAVTGSTFVASSFAEQYAYDYGEDLKTMIEFNTNKDSSIQEQMTVDFEEALKNIHNPLAKNNVDNSQQKKEKEIPSSWYVSQGIII